MTTAGDAFVLRSSASITAALEWTAGGCRGDSRLARAPLVEIAPARKSRTVKVNGRETEATTLQAPLR